MAFCKGCRQIRLLVVNEQPEKRLSIVLNKQNKPLGLSGFKPFGLK
jgi:hypothetical protein